MTTSTWETHLDRRGNPAVDGIWNRGAPWSFYPYEQVLPAELPLDTVMCLPVYSLDSRNSQVMLALRSGGWEIPGGHLNPRAPGGVKSAAAVAARKAREVTGLPVSTEQLIPYGYAETSHALGTSRSRLSYTQFFGVHTPRRPGFISDLEVASAAIFTLDALRRMRSLDIIQPSVVRLADLGIAAMLKHNNISDKYSSATNGCSAAVRNVL